MGLKRRARRWREWAIGRLIKTTRSVVNNPEQTADSRCRGVKLEIGRVMEEMSETGPSWRALWE